jgi:hypothetical protein
MSRTGQFLYAIEEEFWAMLQEGMTNEQAFSTIKEQYGQMGETHAREIHKEANGEKEKVNE